jgi:hypothetical protein
MAKEQHTLTIHNGKITLEVSGIKGKRCLTATADLEKALGVTTSNTPTREYHEAEVDDSKLRQ